MEGLAQELLRATPMRSLRSAVMRPAPSARATSTVPIVSFGADPVRLGLAASLAHLGGNVTGVAMLFAE
jgi:putative ABC transport system substrate-binding protein